MAKSKATIGVINTKKLYKKMDKLESASKKVISNTVKDFHMTAPIWVANAVTEQYYIAKAEVKPKKKGEKKMRTGRLQLRGETIGNAEIVYRGRPLTITHFKKKITGKKHPGTGTTKITASIRKGWKPIVSQGKKITKKQRQNIGRNFKKQGTRNSPKSPLMMLRIGNRQRGGINYIPFGRESQRRNNLKASTTVSLPEMVKDEEVRKDIDEAINEKLGKRFDYYMEKFMC